MPIYEYRCRECGRKSTFVTLSVGAAVEPKCRGCGSADLVKLVSRPAVFRSEESRRERILDPSRLSELGGDDPRAVARWMKKMGKEMGEDAGDGFEEDIDEAMEDAERGKAAEEDDDE